MWRKLVTVVALLLLSPIPTLAGGSVSVRGYHRKDGTYVSPHTRSSPGSGRSQSPVFVPPPVVSRTEYRASPRTSAAKKARSSSPSLHPSTSKPQPEQKNQKPKPTQLSASQNLSEDDIREKKAAGKLVLAKQFIEHTKIETAVRWLKEIVTEYPKTKAAGEAEQLLKKYEHGS
jgi:hypothetical protein